MIETSDLQSMLRLRSGAKPHECEGVLERVLLRPVEEFMGRPGKNVRGRLVEAGFLIASGASELTSDEAKICAGLSRVLESLHAGSLIVDDIQDGSKVRRNAPTLHLQYGMPVALNAGNWLYFHALQQLGHLGVDASLELRLQKMCLDTLVRAHFGQAMDVGTSIDTLSPDQVIEVSMASLELKSGALMALAISLGAAAAGASEEKIAVLDEFGHRFGTALQMFDDLGNLGVANVKRYEDLYLRRPSWVWAFAAREHSERDYSQFVQAVRRLPDESFLNPWLELHSFVPRARVAALEYLQGAIRSLQSVPGFEVPTAGLRLVEGLAGKVARAYE